MDELRFEILEDAANHFGVCRRTINNWLLGWHKSKYPCHYIEKGE